MYKITESEYLAIRELHELYIDLCYQLADEENHGTNVKNMPCIKTIDEMLYRNRHITIR